MFILSFLTDHFRYWEKIFCYFLILKPLKSKKIQNWRAFKNNWCGICLEGLNWNLYFWPLRKRFFLIKIPHYFYRGITWSWTGKKYSKRIKYHLCRLWLAVYIRVTGNFWLGVQLNQSLNCSWFGNFISRYTVASLRN